MKSKISCQRSQCLFCALGPKLSGIHAEKKHYFIQISVYFKCICLIYVMIGRTLVCYNRLSVILGSKILDLSIR